MRLLSNFQTLWRFQRWQRHQNYHQRNQKNLRIKKIKNLPPEGLCPELVGDSRILQDSLINFFLKLSLFNVYIAQWICIVFWMNLYVIFWKYTLDWKSAKLRVNLFHSLLHYYILFASYFIVLSHTIHDSKLYFISYMSSHRF